MSRLAEKRSERKLTQGQLAEKSGIKFQIVQHYETGYRNIDGAKIETLAKLAEALDCKIWEILESDNLRSLVKSAL